MSVRDRMPTGRRTKVPAIVIVVVCAVLAVAALAFAAFSLFGTAFAYADSPAVIASSPADGENAVPTKGRYWVQFENAVCTVQDNAEKVVLENDHGERVAAKHWSVTLPDFETEFGYRQYIWLDVKGLDKGASYRIHVLPGIEAKNGAVSTEEKTIGFSTAAAGSKPSALAKAAVVEGGSGNGDGTGQAAQTNQAADPASGEQAQSPDARGIAIAAVVVVVIAVLLAREISRRRANRPKHLR